MLASSPLPPEPSRHLDLAAEIVSAYVSNNSLPAGELPDLLRSVHETLASIRAGQPAPVPTPEPLRPAVPIRRSVHDDFIVCLENGKRFKSLKRHLASAYGLTPDQYRAKWELPKDYPMVAPAYAKARSMLAREMGLGRKPGDAHPPKMEDELPPEVQVPADAAPVRGRPRSPRKVKTSETAP